MPRRSEWLDYAVYPPDFHKRGICWSFRRVSKARTKAKSLGVGAWIRRYANVKRKHDEIREFEITRRWLWNGERFVRIQKEPEFYRHPDEDLLRSLTKKIAEYKRLNSSVRSG